MRIYIRPSRFLRLRISKRGPRWAIGPRAARLHLGAGGPGVWTGASQGDLVQAAAAAQQKEETITMTGEPSVVRWLDEILPLAMRPTPSGARLDLPPLLHREHQEGPVAERGCH